MVPNYKTNLITLDIILKNGKILRVRGFSKNNKIIDSLMVLK